MMLIVVVEIRGNLEINTSAHPQLVCVKNHCKMLCKIEHFVSDRNLRGLMENGNWLGPSPGRPSVPIVPGSQAILGTSRGRHSFP